MTYQILFPLKGLRASKDLSERAVSAKSGISRAIINKLKCSERNCTIKSINELASFFNLDLQITVSADDTLSEFSTVATAYKTERDGFDSWKIHYMDFLDQFRKSNDTRLVLLPPHAGFDFRLKSLLAAIVKYLAQEKQMPCPAWAIKRYFLETPWFVSGVESLKACALAESPQAFRNNNIYVLENFGSRA